MVYTYKWFLCVSAHLCFLTREFQAPKALFRENSVCTVARQWEGEGLLKYNKHLVMQNISQVPMPAGAHCKSVELHIWGVVQEKFEPCV